MTCNANSKDRDSDLEYIQS